MVELRFPEIAPGAPDEPPVTLLPGTVKVRSAGLVGAARAGAKPRTAQAQPDDVLELRLDGGMLWFVSVEQLQEDLGQSGQRAAPGTLQVPATLFLGGAAQRGLASGVAVAGFRLLEVDLAGAAVDKIADHVESNLKPGPGLYRCKRPDLLEQLDAPPAAGQPLLILLHGTASSTAGSFGRFPAGDSGPWAQLEKFYQDRLYAFEHRTLSESPVTNALALAKLLPATAELHLLSHSRGGLVGELLCGGWSLQGIGKDLFAGRAGATGELALLEELAEVLAAKKFAVTRFVRVACPARGTTLASRRLDRYASLLVNAFGLLPGASTSVTYHLLTSFALAVAKKRTDPTELPGLEAMMPEAPLIRLLNGTGSGQSEADLTVVAGDLAGAGVFGRLKELATNVFYRENHDLVVNTGAMVGGVARRDGGRYYFAKGPEVDHFHYFHNPATVERILWGLTRAHGTSAGFQKIEDTTAKELQTRYGTPRRGETRPLVFVVPGVMGTHLHTKDGRCWLDLPRLARGGFAQLRIGAPGVVEPKTLVASAYQGLLEYLANSHEVRPFPYDWRLSVATESKRLGDEIEQALATQPRPVRILAHSMGGLVARMMIAQRPGLWQRMKATGGRLVQLGTPNGGSFVPVAVMLGREKLLRYLALVDLKHSREQLIEIIANFPGMLEMLPAWGPPDLSVAATWSGLHELWSEGWKPPSAAALESAAAVRKELAASPIEPEFMAYVAGIDEATPTELRTHADRQREQRIEFFPTDQGDGRVPWSTGIPAKVPTWYVAARHGDLPSTRSAFRGYEELLSSGKTPNLPTSPPARGTGRGAAAVARRPEPEEIDIYPDSSDLAAAALGGTAATAAALGQSDLAGEQPALEIAVMHGNLKFTPQAILLGHYERDILASAEAFLDRWVFEGRLSERRNLDRYPGPLGTSAVVFHPRPQARPRAGLIVGLGPVGELTPGKLEEGVCQALIEYAIANAERASAGDNGGDATTLEVASLLIGTGDHLLSTDDSVSAIVGGALRARATLDQGNASRRFRLRKLVFVELYLDRAVQAVRAVESLTRRARFAREIRVEPLLLEGEGGRRRIYYEEDASWWNRLKIEGINQGGAGAGTTHLKFTALTDRARAEEIAMQVETLLVDEFVAAAINASGRDTPVSGTLFELLIPNAIKEAAPQQRPQVLVLDEHSAAYPWELVHDKLRGEQQPFSVRAGLVRQLATSEYRPSPRRALADNALVVGDPPSEFAALPGAAREATAVAELLHEKFRFTVTPRIRESAFDVTQALFERQYRILHFAGHGVYRWDRVANRQLLPGEQSAGEVSGMVLGNGVFLTPGTIEQLRFVPEFVFLNCCYLGQIEADPRVPRSDRPKLAANLATQFIRMGAKAVIAAGWAVADDAAIAFAEDFYGRLAEGKPFGQAVLEARQTIYHVHLGSNTWGAYQCYGDPGWVLSGYKPSAGGNRPWVAFQELVAHLENLSEDARGSSNEDRTWISDQIDQAKKQLDPSWSDKPELLAAFGRAWGEVDYFEEAIVNYQDALSAERVEVSIRAAEQLANLRSRWAVRVLGGGPVSARARKNARAQIDQSIAELEALPTGAKGRSGERWNVLGSAYKRRSIVNTGRARLADLERMRDSYLEAEKIFTDRSPGKLNAYPVLNRLMAQVLLARLETKAGAAQPPVWEDSVATAIAQATEAMAREPNAWSASTLGDALLLRHVAKGDLSDFVEEVAARYREASRFATARETRSVIENLDWLAAMLASAITTETPKSSKERLQLRAAVARIADGIRESLGTPKPPPKGSDKGGKSSGVAAEKAAKKGKKKAAAKKGAKGKGPP